jgi:hypothetical protein
MLHELAHVWVAQHVDARTRDAFLDAVGVERWDGRSPVTPRAIDRATPS